MNDDLWAEAVNALRSSHVKAPLEKLMRREYEKRREQLVSDPSLLNAGKCQELRKWLKDLFGSPIDTQN